MKKHGVTVHCEKCIYASRDTNGNFDIYVPIDDSETGIVGTAKLHCGVSVEHHHIELSSWQDASQHPIRPSEDLQQRVSDVLISIADHRICGNRDICPSEVIEIVEEHSGR
jgi:hypothetical protein